MAPSSSCSGIAATRASLRVVLALCVLAAGVSVMLALPDTSQGAGSATIALDMDPSTPGLQTSVTYPSNVSDVYIDAVVQNADEIGAFEFGLDIPFGLDYVDYALGPFLGSTGRPVQCQQIPPIPETLVRIGCATTGLTPPGPSGDGVLLTLHFQMILPQNGMCLYFYLVETADEGGTPLPTTDQSGCMNFNFPTATPTSPATYTPSPSSTPVPSTTPARTATAAASRTAIATRTVIAQRTATPYVTGTASPAVSPSPESTAPPTGTAAAPSSTAHPTYPAYSSTAYPTYAAATASPGCGIATCESAVLSAPPVVPDATAASGASGHEAGASALPGTGDGLAQTTSNVALAVAIIGMVLVVVAIRLTFVSRDRDRD